MGKGAGMSWEIGADVCTRPGMQELTNDSLLWCREPRSVFPDVNGKEIRKQGGRVFM